MHIRTKKLHKIMSDNELTCREVGDLLGRSEQTVLIWRCSTDANKKIIPSHQLELLELKLAQQARQ